MTQVDQQAELWLRRFSAPPDRSSRIVCFPHAGGSATYFFPLHTVLGGDVEVLGVQYPGRQDRRLEPAVGDMHQLADRVSAVLERLDTGARTPTVFFGHSMGAVLAYEVARRLERGGGGPAAVVVSGRWAASIHRDDQLHRQPDAALITEVRRLSGTHSSLLDDEDLVRMVLPAIRADYRATETYRHPDEPVLRCPLTAFVGDVDPRVTVTEAQAWRAHTTGVFDLRVFAGGHFYLGEQWPAVAAELRGLLDRTSAAASPDQQNRRPG